MNVLVLWLSAYVLLSHSLSSSVNKPSNVSHNFFRDYKRLMHRVDFYYHRLIAGSLEAAYSLNWGAREIWGKGGGETLALL